MSATKANQRAADGMPPAEARLAPPAAPHGTVPLCALQRWFAAAVMHPGGAAAGLAQAFARGRGDVDAADVEQILLPSPSLSAFDRLAIYADAYRARLVECLADDYPALKHALGDDAFESLCRRYIARHPSTSPNLNPFGRHLPAFCRSDAGGASSFAADLAALEWAMVEVLHAPSPEPLTLADMAAIPAGAWADARFAPSPTLRVLSFDYPVNAYFQAFRTDLAPELPASAWSATAVFRQGLTIWRMDLARAKHALLVSLLEGTALGPALDALAAAGLLTAEQSAEVMVWFRDWVGHGFFAGIESA